MATRVVVVRICDICNLSINEGDSRIITSVEIAFNKGAYEVDACEACFDADPFTKAMRQVKKERQVKPRVAAAMAANEAEAPAKKTYNVQRGKFPCSECDFVGKSPNALAAHSRKHR